MSTDTCNQTDAQWIPNGDLPLHYNLGGICNKAEALKQWVDNVAHPPHYKQGEIECIDAIQAALTPEEFRGYCKGNSLKYVWRELHKGGTESLEKAKWYLNRITGDSNGRTQEK